MAVRYRTRGESPKGGTVALSTADTAAEYTRYAEHCVETARILREQKARTLHREMAAEWIKLAQRLLEEATLSARPTTKHRKTSQG
jgi:RNA 3'-terminal phosphate cyclase